ncbi:MAG: glycosyltransferase family 2 protein [Vampirovibrionales bacterium]|nr:glycosyltransferase family 2 protein [Vampirovibrionales bacterium]
MERRRLAILIISVLTFGLLVNRFIPQVSALAMLIVLIVLYLWLLTLSMVHRKRMDLKRPRPINRAYQPKVSIIIAAHNEQNVIAQTVETMLALSYPDFEVLVMDDRSTDSTPVILQGLARKLDDARFRYFVRPSDAFPGKSAVLNDALTLTDGEVICVFDADASVAPDFLYRIVPFLADDNVGAVQARKVIANADYNWLTHCQNYEYSLDAYVQCGRESVYGAVELRGNGELIKREALNDVDGFNNYSITDDLDVSTRLHLAGWDIRFAHKVLVFEEGITEFKPLLKQRKRWAEGSLVRYLENMDKLLITRNVSIRTMLDMIAYMVQFMLPLWVVLDLLALGVDAMFGEPTRTRVLSSLLITPIIAIGSSHTLVIAIIRFNCRANPDGPLPWESVMKALPHALQWAGYTGLYMTSLWLPTTFAMTMKLLFNKERSLSWERTEHKGHSHQTLPVSPNASTDSDSGSVSSLSPPSSRSA